MKEGTSGKRVEDTIERGVVMWELVLFVCIVVVSVTTLSIALYRVYGGSKNDDGTPSA